MAAWFTRAVETPPAGAPRPWIPASARFLRYVLAALLAACAALTVAWLPELRTEVLAGRWPRGVLAIPPGLLALFICGYAVYRLALVRAGRYPAGKALAQLGLMLLALGVVTGLALDPRSPPVRGNPLARALHSGDPDVRAMAAELARHRPAQVARPLLPRLAELLGDADPLVRLEAHESLVAIVGEDLGDGPEAAARWRARVESLGEAR
jgi:hypothetical protein